MQNVAVRIAQLSDPHVTTPGADLDVRCRTAAHLARAVEHVGRVRPDLVVITGDLVDHGGADEYARLRGLLAGVRVPVHVIPGNHDARGPLAEAFGLSLDGGFVRSVVDAGALRLVLLDSSVPGAPHGELCDERLAWLDARLAERPDRPTLVFLHHPPFRTGLARMDEMGLVAPERLAAVIGRHRHVERVAAGHVHRAMTRRFAGTIACTAPSTAHQLTLDLDPDAPIGVELAPPGILLHVWDGSGLVTHVDPIGEFPSVTK